MTYYKTFFQTKQCHYNQNAAAKSVKYYSLVVFDKE